MSADDRNLTLRTLDVLEALCSFAAGGASNGDLAHHTKTSATNITRCTTLLRAQGWARKDEATGRFFPQPAFTRLMYQVDADFARAQTALDDRRRNATGR